MAQRNIPTREETKRINGFAYFEQNLQNGKKQYRLQSRISLNTPHAGICYKVDEHFLEWLLGTPIKEPAQAFIDRVRGRKYNSGQKYYSIDWITKYLMRVQPKKKKADR
ncbi:MAG: hypothetical protein HUJ71_01850 [Pseudobutyrivibrio sp.]|nr:hypothetical protein [Pseudobutyrivibrio sp.]